MEGSVQTEQALLEELSTLRMRVAELEQTLNQLNQERKEGQAKELALLKANQHMDEFLSTSSHELRTPLTTINGNIQLAKRRLKVLRDSQEVTEETGNKLDFVQELLSRAERQVRVQNRLVGDLLDVSRIQSNRLELQLSNCDLVEIVREVVEDQRVAAPTRQITVAVPYAMAVPIKADKDRIIQAVTNYVTNALKYSGADQPVEVQLTIEGQQARVSVKDQGPGLPLEELAQIWQRFYRVPSISVVSGAGTGLGLGLHICKTIIERHHGLVGVNSISGQGSTFWFTIPVIDPATFID